MAALKLSVTTTSICGKKSSLERWIRGVTTASAVPTATHARASTTSSTSNGSMDASGTPIRKCGRICVRRTIGSTSFGELSSIREIRGSTFFALSSRLYSTSQGKQRDSSIVAEMVSEKGPSWDSHHGLQKSPVLPQRPSKWLTLPTLLTIGRVASVPLLVSTFHIDGWLATTATTGIFIAAAITDWLDGYLARKMRLGTAFGAFLDPVADKLMVASTLILLCSTPLGVSGFDQGQWLLTLPAITIIGREITMSAVREWAASQNSKISETVAVNNLGKWKTASQMVALTLLLATRSTIHSVTAATALFSSGVALLYLSAGLSIWSLVMYMRKIWRLLLKH